MAYFNCATCHKFGTIQTYKLNVLIYFKFIFRLLKDVTCGNTSFTPIVNKNSYILVANNNMYMVNQRINLYFVDFSFIQNSLLFATNVLCDLSNTTNEILVANVACN